MPRRKNQYVVNHEGGWAVRGENESRITRHFETQEEAIEFGRAEAEREEAELVIQGRDGQFREKHSFGNDPYPPPG